MPQCQDDVWYLSARRTTVAIDVAPDVYGLDEQGSSHERVIIMSAAREY
jgi:hypothetical protein